ncbi:MAG: 8-oxo-dGTP diphosphatase [Firmicutes bacterium]|nr:8-oxo-dGTP diphosphatase [Bacillota bacterium]
MKEIVATLLWVVQDGRILLGRKKRGWRAGIYNGIGGKVDEGEDITAAAIRETQEEIGITPTKFEKVGLAEFIVYFKGERARLFGHMYIATEYEGEPTESDEMAPAWFDIDQVPYSEMWSGDILWLPRLLNGEKLEFFMELDEDNNVVTHNLQEELK